MNKIERYDLVEQIEASRKILGLAMEDIAQSLGVRYQTYWHWLKKRGYPSGENCNRMKAFLENSRDKVNKAITEQQATLRKHKAFLKKGA